jgi:hypothetical protein
MLTSIQADTGATDAPSRDETIRDIAGVCIEISTAAKTLGKIADQAIDDLDGEGQEFAHSVDLLAGGIGRRVRRIMNFLDRQGAQDRPNGTASAGENFEAIREILRERIEGWKNYSGIRLEGEEEAFRSAEDAALEALRRLSPKGIEAAMAKLIILQGTEINAGYRHENFGERLEYEALAAGLEYFGLRELYNSYFPAKREASPC